MALCKESNLKALLEATGKDSPRESLCGIYYEEINGIPSFTATDGHILITMRKYEAVKVKNELETNYNITPSMYQTKNIIYPDPKNRPGMKAILKPEECPYPDYQKTIPRNFTNPSPYPYFSLSMMERFKKINKFLEGHNDVTLYQADYWNSPIQPTVKLYGENILLLIMPIKLLSNVFSNMDLETPIMNKYYSEEE